MAATQSAIRHPRWLVRLYIMPLNRATSRLAASMARNIMGKGIAPGSWLARVLPLAPTPEAKLQGFTNRAI